MALKKCFKLHKLFLSELERCERLDREGAQVLASLANVAKRVPLLAEGAAPAALGVLALMPDTPALLLERHFAAMEKSAAFLRDIVRDLADAVRRLRGFADEFVDLVDELSLIVDDQDDRSASPLEAAMSMLEWIENVRSMYERDALRKRLLVADVEYWDVMRLQRMHREWPASASTSFVDVAYVRRGTEELPPLPVVSETGGESTAATASKKRKKKK